MKFAIYALWSVAAGALIPVMAVLNARLGRALGAPTLSVVILFAVGLAVAAGAHQLLNGRWSGFQTATEISALDVSGGLIVAFYVVSVTLLAPRFGIGNTILCIMVAQIAVSAAIDHFGLFGAVVRSVDPTRIAGIAAMLVGLTITQVAGQRGP